MERLSESAYEIAGLLMTGAYTIHDIRASLVGYGVPSNEVAKIMFNACSELARREYIVWSYEEDWGNKPPKSPSAYTEEAFQDHWNECFPNGEIKEGIPDADSKTLFLEATEKLANEID